jgi:gas vesicle protein
MSKEKKVSSGIVVLASVIGGILGASAGLLLAPQPGKKTQEMIKEAYSNALDNLSTLAKSIDNKANELLSRVTEDLTEMPDHVKSEIEKLKESAENLYASSVDKGKTYLEDIKKTISTSIEEGKKKFEEEKARYVDV